MIPMLRRANSIIALLLLAVFAAHAIMGTLFCWRMLSDELSWVVWVGIGITAVHVVLSVGTTRQMLCDKSRPPSAKKKAHQLKKWVSGIVVGTIAVAHALLIFGSTTWAIVSLLVDVSLAAHICISAKSLTKDLGFVSGFRYAIRALAVAIAMFASLGLCSVSGVFII